MVSAILLATALAAAAPATHADAIRATVEITDLSSLALSPDGHWLAFRTERASVARNTHDLTWFVVPSDGSAPPRRIGDGGEGEWRDGGTLSSALPVWTPDSRAIVFRKVADAQVQLWRVPRDGAMATQLSHDAGNVRRFAGLPDGRFVYEAGASRDAVVAAETAEYDHGIRIDATIDPGRNLYRSIRIDGRMASDRLTGFWFSHAGLLHDAPGRFVSVDPQSGETQSATPGEISALSSDVQPFEKVGDRYVIARALANDGATATLLADGRDALLQVRLKGGPVRTCAAPACRGRLKTVAWQQGARAIVFTASDAAINDTVYRWDLTNDTVRPIGGGSGRFDGGHDGDHGCAIGAATVFCVNEAANTPPQLVAIDLASGAEKILTAPNAELEDRSANFEMFSWTDGTGRRFSGQLAHSASVTPAPLFVVYYSCEGFLRGSVGDEYPLRQLADAGFAVLCINAAYGGLGIDDRLATLGTAQRGIEAAIDQLAARGVVDPTRVGMGGLSFGAEVTGWMLSQSHRLAAAAISSTLITRDFFWFNAHPGAHIQTAIQQAYHIGSPEEDTARWRMLSPEYRIDAITAPLLMQLPEQEYRFNIAFANKLSRAGKPVDVWAFPDELHIKRQPRHKLAVYERNLDWFRFWLQGVIDPAPEKREQYRVWTTLRAMPHPASVASRRSQASVSTKSRMR